MATELKTNATDRPTWGPTVRTIVSMLVVLHVAVVVIGPLSLPPSWIGSRLRSFVYPYMEAMFLGHAYKFFAPEPGPSHLVHYELELADGSTRKGVFPNLSEEWPRLLYHRHFMLTERVAAGPPDLPPAGASGQGQALPQPAPRPDEQPPLTQWEQDFARSYANHLKTKYQARRVTLTLERHLFPSMADVQQGLKLDDAKLKQYRNLGTY
ncbi:MAG: hypothetical protein JSS27_18830 [Planctomycetes bacterium]|nr:hypothetical protein [Planctomycetota bacterium]